METLKKLFTNFKKHSKIYIAFAMIITCVFGVMFISNTFAYETDRFSYTVDNISFNSYSDNVEMIENSDNTITFRNLTSSRACSFYTQFNDFKSSNALGGGYYLLINYYIATAGSYGGTYVRRVLAASGTNTTSCQLTSNFTNTITGLTTGNSRVSYINYSDRYYITSKSCYCNCIMLNTTSINDFQFNEIQFTLTTGVLSTGYWEFTIKNIDIVPESQLSLNQYYETYYGDIETNYNELLQDYDDLQNDYDELNDNYIDLESNYNDLSQDYDDLTSQYNELMENTNNNLYGSIYSAFNGATATLYNVSSSSLNVLLNTTPYETASCSVNSFTLNNPLYNTIVNNNNGDLVARCMILIPLNTPQQWQALTFTRVDKNQNRFIYLYFTDGTSEQVTILDSGDYDTQSITWVNQLGKTINYIAFDNEPNFDSVSTISVATDSLAYDNGYNKGYAQGQYDREALDNEIIERLKNQNGYDNGYNDGFNAAIENDFTNSGLNTLFNAILSYPVNFIKEVFNFNFMGINIAGFITFIISIAIVIFVINYFRKK